MKEKIAVWIILSLLIITLNACRGDQATPEIPPTASGPVEEQPESEMAFPAPESDPVEDSYPIVEDAVPPVDAAYPVTDEDIQLLIGTWTLETYSEAGDSQEPEAKTLTFNADGTYEIITEGVTTTGTWSTRLGAYESTLILESDIGEMQTFEIIELIGARLHLRSARDGVRIDEEYLPAE